MTTKKSPSCYRLLHTADWHLGKMLNDQSRDEEHAQFLEWLLLAVKEHEVDAIVLAGDVFDSANPPQSALTRYYNFVSALFRQGSCAFAVVGGNHDSAALLEAPKMALNALNTHVAGHLAENPSDRILLLPDSENPRVAIAMLPFLRDRDLRVGKDGDGAEEIREQLVSGIKKRYEEAEEAVRGLKCPIVATGHLTVAGASASDSEREIHIGGLGAVGSDIFPDAFSYIALGHLHRPQATDAMGRIRYAGSPIALSFSEADDDKEARILDITPEGISHFGLPVPALRKLSQIRTTKAGLEQALAAFDVASSKLRPWVEVVVEDADLETDLVERVRSLCEGKDFDVLKILRGKTAPITGMTAGEASDDEAIESLLDKPSKVFEHLLEEHQKLGEEEREALKNSFQILLDLSQQIEAGSQK
jgi:exonuclease SbcD